MQLNINVWKSSSKVALLWNCAELDSEFSAMSEEECRTVLNTLEMYKALQILLQQSGR